MIEETRSHHQRGTYIGGNLLYVSSYWKAMYLTFVVQDNDNNALLPHVRVMKCVLSANVLVCQLGLVSEYVLGFVRVARQTVHVETTQ